MGFEQVEFKAIPPAFRANRQEKAGIGIGDEGRGAALADGDRRVWISHESDPRSAQGVEFILHENLEAPMDRNHGKPRVARLLKSLNEKGAIALWGEDMGVEVGTLDFLGVGENDPTDSKGRELRPKPAHHFRSRHREEEIHPGHRRWSGLEHATQFNHAVLHRLDGGDTQSAIQHAHAHRLAHDHTQDLRRVNRSRTVESHRTVGCNLARFEDDEIQGGYMRLSGSTSTETPGNLIAPNSAMSASCTVSRMTPLFPLTTT